MEQAKGRRRRGVILTAAGVKRLKTAIATAEITQHQGAHFTFEELSERMSVSTKTLGRLWSLNAGVDQRTIKLCFSAFGLNLCQQDYTTVSEADEDKTSETISSSLDEEEIYLSQNQASSNREQGDQSQYLWSYPSGPVPIGSPFYIERPPTEELAHREVTQPGCLLRIRAPKEMGKSSLVLRLLAFSQQQKYQSVILDCCQIDSFYLNDLELFLRCFCWQVAKELGIEPKLDDYWDEETGSKLSCSFYLKNYLLKQVKNPLVLVLEQADHFFKYPQLAQDFFPLLRSWYEESRHDTNWQKLRLVVVYSTEEYVSLDINRSPFNVGLPLTLPELTQQQIEELAQRYGLDWNAGNEAAKLMWLVGGHPALIRIALYYLCWQKINLEDLIQEAIANGGIYRHHLWRHWMLLQKEPPLVEAYAKIVIGTSNSLSPIEAYRLESLGLIRYDFNCVKPRCQLYCAYFKNQLSTIC